MNGRANVMYRTCSTVVRAARNTLTLIGVIAVALALALLRKDGSVTAVPSAFPEFDAVYEVPVRSGLKLERLEYRGKNDWRLTTVRDDSNPEAVGSYKAAEADRHISFNSKFNDQQESEITPGTEAIPGPWLRPAAALVGVTSDVPSGGNRVVTVRKSAQCPEVGSAEPSEEGAASVNGSDASVPECHPGLRAIEWQEEYTYDAKSGVPLRVRVIADGRESDVRRAVSLTVR